MARGSVSRARRNATGSAPAAAASSSVKLSTANTLAILPGARRFDSCSGVSFIQCTTTRTLATCVRRIAVLRDRAGALRRAPARCRRRRRRAARARPARCVGSHISVSHADDRARARRARRAHRAAAAAPSDPSRVRPGASTARGPAGRSSSTAAPRRPRRDRRRWCRTIPSRRGRRRASFPAAGRTPSPGCARRPCVPCDATRPSPPSPRTSATAQRRAERRVALERPEVGRRELLRGAGDRRRRIAARHDGLIALDGGAARPAIEPIAAGQRLALRSTWPSVAPAARTAAHSSLDDHARENCPMRTTRTSGNAAHRRFVDRHQRRADRRRANHSAVQHAGTAKSCT